MLLGIGPQPLQILRILEDVHLIGHHNHGPLGQLGRILLQLAVDGHQVLHGISPLAAGHVHNVDNQPAPVNMPQEVMAQAHALGCTLDDAGDICHHKALPFAQVHNAQVGEQRGKMVIRNFRMRTGHHGKQRGFSHIGEAHQAHIRQQLQLQNHLMALAGQTCLGKPGRLPGGGSKPLVAPAASTALGQDKILLVGHIVDDLAGFCVPYHRAQGHKDNQVVAIAALHVAALAVAAGLRRIPSLVTEIHQRGHAAIHPQHHAAAMTAVAAVRPARSDIFLPPEGHAAVAAVPRLDKDLYLIDKLCHCHSPFV